MSGPVDRTAAVLVEADFTVLAQPVEVAGIKFRFSATLASSQSLDLVVLIDTFESGTEESARREVTALARALDLARSRRPLTVVLIGQRWSEVTERAMTNVARVLRCEAPFEEALGDATVRNALAVLLPLTVATAPEQPEDVWSTVRADLEASLADPELARLMQAAPRGSGRVHNLLMEYLSEPLDA